MENNKIYEQNTNNLTIIEHFDSSGNLLYKEQITPKEIIDPIKEQVLLEIDDLKYWFDTYYSQHAEKYQRLIGLNSLCDDGSDPAIKLNELYIFAEQKRKRIKLLETQL